MENLQTLGSHAKQIRRWADSCSKQKMTEYEFELKFKLSDEEDPELIPGCPF